VQPPGGSASFCVYVCMYIYMYVCVCVRKGGTAKKGKDIGGVAHNHMPSRLLLVACCLLLLVFFSNARHTHTWYTASFSSPWPLFPTLAPLLLLVLPVLLVPHIFLRLVRLYFVHVHIYIYICVRESPMYMYAQKPKHNT
jgi:hypothetical protein